MKKLTVYIEDDMYEKIVSTAIKEGMTLTEFGLKAMLFRVKELDEDNTKTIDPKEGFEDKGDHFLKVSFFLSKLLRSAKVKGSGGYHSVGYWFTSYLPELEPSIFPHAHWVVRIGELSAYLKDDNKKNAVNWLMRYFPDLMKEIPSNKRASFLGGVSDWFRRMDEKDKVHE